MSLSTKRIIFIVGPTAIGKTALSLKLAKKLQTEIISCDSRQFYKELKIGSAPPTKENLLEVKHHFIHNLSIHNDYNAGKFEIDAINLIKKLHKKNNTIIAVGGSGLYIDAICQGFDKIPPISKQSRDKARKKYQNKGLSWLQQEFKYIDPENYSSYDLNNSQRLLREIEVFYETGQKLSSFKTNKVKKRSFEIIKIGLNIERNLLYELIDKRVDLMMSNGLLEEVKSLSDFQNINALQTVGYKELFKFINNQYTLEEAVKNIKKNTRRFAKRQLTWFRKDKSIKWIKPDQLTTIAGIISES